MTDQKHWIRSRWLELRLGYSSYFAYILAFFNVTLLVSLRFNVSGFQLILLMLVISAVNTGAGILVGHYHLKWQQTTDVKLEYEYVIEETAKRVIKKLEEKEKGCSN